MAKACEECTHNCLMMHKKFKNPSPLVTTFVKFMIGDDYSKRLFLPPNFACRVKKLVGKTTRLEDSNGEKCDVTYTKIDDRLAFEQGWDRFALKHRLQKGDVLVFHYIMKSHFVVLMYGSTGCPENRHLGFPHLPMKETKKGNNNLTVNGQSSSKVHANCNESSSKPEPVGHGVNDMKTMSKKLNEAKMLSPNENAINAQRLVASSSRPADKERDQTSELLVNKAFPDYIFSDSPTAVKPLCLVDNDIRHEKDERGRNSLQPVALALHGGQKNNVAASDGGSDGTEINRVQKSVETDGGQKNNVATSSGGPDETEINRIQKLVETDGGQKNNVAAGGGGLDETEVNRTRKSVELGSGQKNNVDASGGGSDETERKRILRKLDAALAISDAKRKGSAVFQNEIAHNNSTHKRWRPADFPTTPAKNVKQEPDTSRSHNSGYPLTPKPTAKRMEPTKKEPTMNNGSVGPIKEEPKTNHGSDGVTKREPKPEPVDYDEEPVSGSSNASFSATMSSYQYLELPSWVKVKGTEKGVKLGDKCEFVLESEPVGLGRANSCACSVFAVNVTR
ncbi:putative transcription factor B3-Domain family [Helianthus annuus]|nr:putative transcription factor B3-Domain family [Helianthus annuus]